MNACPTIGFSALKADDFFTKSDTSYVLARTDRSPATENLLLVAYDNSVALRDAIREASESGTSFSWNMIPAAIRVSYQLAAVMPFVHPYISDSGSVVFDWDEDSENMISIMLLGRNRIGWAGYFSGDRVHGSAKFDAEFPEELSNAIQRWQAQRRASSGRWRSSFN